MANKIIEIEEPTQLSEVRISRLMTGKLCADLVYRPRHGNAETVTLSEDDAEDWSAVEEQVAALLKAACPVFCKKAGY